MTALVTLSNRNGPLSALGATATTVPVDAAVSEFFTLPAGYGDLLIIGMNAAISSLSGAYVPPTPLRDGPWFTITDSQGITTLDSLGSVEWTHASTSATRPLLVANIELFRPRVLLLGERLYITSPIIGGAGVTASVQCRLTGQRINTA